MHRHLWSYSLLILASNTFGYVCGSVSNRVKFWSLQKAIYNLSPYGSARGRVTQELFQAVYNLISDQSKSLFPRGPGIIDLEAPVIWYDIDTLCCFLFRQINEWEKWEKWIWPGAIFQYFGVTVGCSWCRQKKLLGDNGSIILHHRTRSDTFLCRWTHLSLL